MRKSTSKLAAFAALVLATPASATDLCQIRFLSDYHSEEAPSPIAKRGETLKNVTQYWLDERGGRYCIKGGLCYLESVDGKTITVLENCVVDVNRVELINDEPREFLFGLKLVRSSVDTTQLRIDDVEKTLVEIGMGLAPADNAAMVYVLRPKSDCAFVVQNALEGNTDARQMLLEGVADCPVQANAIFAERASSQ